MSKELLSLKPARLWYYFTEILKIPRPSKKEEKIISYLLDFGKKHKLETIQDEVGNILIRKQATSGMENRKVVTLQSHMDMVCEKNSDKVFDFDNDPIEAWIDNEWVKAKGTTLGADDGIGIAAQLALLESDSTSHGPIECLFTVDEETGLTGAFGLKPGFLKGEILLNLDSEDDGQLFIGCAGGKDTVATLQFSFENSKQESTSYSLSISGLLGGHSGDDIQRGRGNANKILNRMLWYAGKNHGLRLTEFNGGNLRNAIAREAYALVTIPSENIAPFETYISSISKLIKAEFKITEPDLEINLSRIDSLEKVIDKSSQDKLLNALYSCPHGVIAWSAEIENFVETSTNLASVKFSDSKIEITTSQRSSVESAKDDIGNMVASVFNLINADVMHTDGYPGWKPNPDSEIVALTSALYRKLFNMDPEVLAIHAGLECGLIGDVYPNMDMISYGPTIKGAHSPDERLKIDTVKKFWDLTIEVLKNIPEKK
ncbi:MAG: aminoacyl-histidine dipeptidase [Bacteroidales bacterium]|nr:aminoacyl-histidine dipeptidase [Bacteroidales bacterium]MCF8404477.1 aminoacyl-histidine dipeptidase [Bacteroidales bacterium]